jgi:gliding motility-associated-like protein
VTLNLVVAPIYSQTIPIDLCSGGVYQYSDTALTTAGNYVFEFQSVAGCDSIITIALNILPAYQVNQVISACDSYFWNITNQNYTQSGVYQFLYTTEGGCDSLFILNLSVYPTPNAPVLTGNFPKCPGDAFIFSAESSTFGINWTGPSNYSSNQFSNSIPLFTAQTGIYSAILTANGCSSPSSSIIAAIEFNNPLDFAAFPNVLTPNADGVNDVLNLPEYAKSCAKFNISIYNRWGVVVYTGDETSQPFDGTANGTKLTSGVYFYKLLFEDKEKSGFIHLFD